MVTECKAENFSLIITKEKRDIKAGIKISHMRTLSYFNKNINIVLDCTTIDCTMIEILY